MLSSVLRSERAVQVNVAIMRALGAGQNSSPCSAGLHPAVSRICNPQAIRQSGGPQISAPCRMQFGDTADWEICATKNFVAHPRAFVSLRRMLARDETLARKLAELERRLEGHDQAIKSLFDAIRELMAPPAKPKREIGFHAIGKEVTDRGTTKFKRK